MHLRVMKAEEDMNQQGEPQQRKYSLKLSRKSVVLLKSMNNKCQTFLNHEVQCKHDYIDYVLCISDITMTV